MKKATLFLAVGLVLSASGFFWFLQSMELKGGGAHALKGLSANVTVEEDAQGVPTLSGQSLADVVRGQGWILARDRLFQMDLIRRRSAGKLAEVFGAGALESDRTHRIYGFSVGAKKVVEGLVPESRELLQAFAQGVNAFLLAGPLPLEIRLIGYRPEPWAPEDTVLVALSMFDPPDSERAMRLIHDLLPEPAIRFFTPAFGLFDAPIVADPQAPPLPPLPPAQAFKLRAALPGQPTPPFFAERVFDGSNAWAIAGTRTATGKPILAGDPHLHLALPNVWYRLKLKGPDFEVTGVTLPGIPGILIGTNGHLAWSFTNGMADHADQVVLESAGDPNHYLMNGARTAYRERNETILVKGQAPVPVAVRETVWGPVITDGGKEYALQWVALDWAHFSRMEMTRLDRARDLDAAFAALREWCGPVHNAILASSDGHIGWTVVGSIPNRVGFDGSVSVPRDRTRYWNGYIPLSEYPKVVDPPSGFLASANQRSIPWDRNPGRFSTDWSSPARAFRIQGELSRRRDWDALSSYHLQLDVFSVVHDRYRQELLRALAKKTDPWSKEISRLLTEWDGQITTASPGYVFLRKYREALFNLFLGSVTARIPSAEDRDQVLERLSRDEWMAALFKEKPLHLLDSRFPDYATAARQTALEVAQRLADRPEKLWELKWGDSNRLVVRHPFSLVLPKPFWRWINLPELPLPGASLVPREGNPSHAASMRMVIDLSDPRRSIFNQPGGQSGHFLSAHYRDQFRAWLDGTPRPFEPGETKATTTLTP